MSSHRSQNGPSLTKATYADRRPKPMTDDELAADQARQKARQEQIERDAAKARKIDHDLKKDFVNSFRRWQSNKKT
jgi:hypothetical protein